jgi:hypothetical protein
MAEISKIRINGVDLSIEPEWASVSDNTLTIGTDATEKIHVGTLLKIGTQQLHFDNNVLLSDDTSLVESGYIQLGGKENTSPSVTIDESGKAITATADDITLKAKTVTANAIMTCAALNVSTIVADTINSDISIEGNLTATSKGKVAKFGTLNIGSILCTSSGSVSRIETQDLHDNVDGAQLLLGTGNSEIQLNKSGIIIGAAETTSEIQIGTSSAQIRVIGESSCVDIGNGSMSIKGNDVTIGTGGGNIQIGTGVYRNAITITSGGIWLGTAGGDSSSSDSPKIWLGDVCVTFSTSTNVLTFSYRDKSATITLS